NLTPHITIAYPLFFVQKKKSTKRMAEWIYMKLLLWKERMDERIFDWFADADTDTVADESRRARFMEDIWVAYFILILFTFLFLAFLVGFLVALTQAKKHF
ncbi:hypothetical protein AABB24_019173, partial [Solanum stoloniferum]